MAGQVCHAKIICQDETSKRLLERGCRNNDFWTAADRQKVYPTVVIKHITKYMKEIEIGRDKLSLYDDAFDVTPFYPLLAFPDRNDKKFLQFEKRMIDAERRRNGQKITPPNNRTKDIDFGFEAALAEIESGNRSISRRVTNREVSRMQS